MAICVAFFANQVIVIISIVATVLNVFVTQGVSSTVLLVIFECFRVTYLLKQAKTFTMMQVLAYDFLFFFWVKNFSYVEHK